jgi:hypothetical protein
MTAPITEDAARHLIDELRESAKSTLLLPPPDGSVVESLHELLNAHQELSRVQGNRILELETELAKALARLRAADITIATLQTRTRALEPRRP